MHKNGKSFLSYSPREKSVYFPMFIVIFVPPDMLKSECKFSFTESKSLQARLGSGESNSLQSSSIFYCCKKFLLWNDRSLSSCSDSTVQIEALHTTANHLRDSLCA